MMKLLTENILGYPVANCGKVCCIEIIRGWIKEDQESRWLACLNPHSYAEAQKQPHFKEALLSADLIIPDGVGIVIASRVFGGMIRERVTGYDIFTGVLRHLNNRGGHRVFFLGSTEDNLKDIQQRMMRDYPNVTVAGTYSPPFKNDFSAEDQDAMVTAINEASPDVLWLGMAAPKQEIWLLENLDRLDSVRIAAAIGAVFDFYTGRVKRPHPFFQNLGLEWLPRLIKQPRHLWRRTFVSAPFFLFMVLRERVKQMGCS